jgi:hypothetical protein
MGTKRLRSPYRLPTRKFSAAWIPAGTLVLLIALGASAGPERESVAGEKAQEEPAWRESLAYTVGEGTYWWTSNAEHMGEGVEPPAYGTAWEYGVGKTSVRGCLFSETDEGPRLEWEFFQAWDPAEQSLYSWQTTESGGVGSGYAVPVGIGDTGEMVQTFVWPDGTEQRIRHEAIHAHQDTMVTRSFNWIDGEWKPRRTYTWIRRAGDPQEKCANLARGADGS